MFYDDVKGNNFGIIIKGAERERERERNQMKSNLKWNVFMRKHDRILGHN